MVPCVCLQVNLFVRWFVVFITLFICLPIFPSSGSIFVSDNSRPSGIPLGALHLACRLLQLPCLPQHDRPGQEVHLHLQDPGRRLRASGSQCPPFCTTSAVISVGCPFFSLPVPSFRFTSFLVVLEFVACTSAASVAALLYRAVRVSRQAILRFLPTSVVDTEKIARFLTFHSCSLRWFFTPVAV